MISFESGSGWFQASEGLHYFRGRLDGSNIRCVISQITLEALAGERTSEARPGELFDAIEHRVFELAARKIRVAGRDPHGAVAISTMDIALLSS